MWVRIVPKLLLAVNDAVTKVNFGVGFAETGDRGRNQSTSFLAGDQIHKGAALGNKIKTKIKSNYPTLRQKMAEG